MFHFQVIKNLYDKKIFKADEVLQSILSKGIKKYCKDLEKLKGSFYNINQLHQLRLKSNYYNIYIKVLK
jgi:hypothetical protein